MLNIDVLVYNTQSPKMKFMILASKRSKLEISENYPRFAKLSLFTVVVSRVRAFFMPNFSQFMVSLETYSQSQLRSFAISNWYNTSLFTKRLFENCSK